MAEEIAEPFNRAERVAVIGPYTLMRSPIKQFGDTDYNLLCKRTLPGGYILTVAVLDALNVIEIGTSEAVFVPGQEHVFALTDSGRRHLASYLNDIETLAEEYRQMPLIKRCDMRNALYRKEPRDTNTRLYERADSAKKLAALSIAVETYVVVEREPVQNEE